MTSTLGFALTNAESRQLGQREPGYSFISQTTVDPDIELLRLRTIQRIENTTVEAPFAEHELGARLPGMAGQYIARHGLMHTHSRLYSSTRRLLIRYGSELGMRIIFGAVHNGCHEYPSASCQTESCKSSWL